jgi:hypothetical protein
MKKVLFTFCMAALGLTGFAAQGEPANTKAVETFQKVFATATQVEWGQVAEMGLTKASFLYNGGQAQAYFNGDGEMVAAARYIGQEQLPMAVARLLAEKYAGYAMAPNIIEYEGNGQTAYYVTMAGSKQDIVVKAAADGNATVYKRIKK